MLPYMHMTNLFKNKFIFLTIIYSKQTHNLIIRNHLRLYHEKIRLNLTPTTTTTLARSFLQLLLPYVGLLLLISFNA